MNSIELHRASVKMTVVANVVPGMEHVGYYVRILA